MCVCNIHMSIWRPLQRAVSDVFCIQNRIQFECHRWKNNQSPHVVATRAEVSKDPALDPAHWRNGWNRTDSIKLLIHRSVLLVWNSEPILDQSMGSTTVCNLYLNRFTCLSGDVIVGCITGWWMKSCFLKKSIKRGKIWTGSDSYSKSCFLPV